MHKYYNRLIPGNLTSFKTNLNKAERGFGLLVQVRLLVLIKDDKYVGWENLMALKVIRLYWSTSAS